MAKTATNELRNFSNRSVASIFAYPNANTQHKATAWCFLLKTCKGRKMVQQNAVKFCNLLDTSPLAPLNDDFILQIVSAEIKKAEPEKLLDLFFQKYKIQIPVMRHADKVYLRYSINAFNDQTDLDKLFINIEDIKITTNLIG